MDMAVPVSGPMSASQIAQQKLQDPSSQVAKQGQSKFDQAMNKAGQVQGPQEVQAANAVQRANQVEQVHKLDPSKLNNIQTSTGQNANTLSARAVEPVAGKPETSRALSMMSGMMTDMEKGQGVLDKLINSGLHGAKFSNAELLSLQAGMYKYTQELDLTGKVVDKATSGLKDTLK